PGFNFDWSKVMTISFVSALFADALSQMYFATAVREKEKGNAEQLMEKYLDQVQDHVYNKDIGSVYRLLKKAVHEFNNIGVSKGVFPRIGIVGEIYVKYNSFGNHYAVDWLLQQGIEPVVPPLIDFFTQELVNYHVNRKANLAKTRFKTDMYIYFIEYLSNKYIRRVNRIVSNFRFYTPFHNIRHISARASKILSLANQSGEGWLIPAEMATFADSGINNVVSFQPFGCIANHVISKGIEKRLRDLYPQMNILYLDFDDGTSEVNMLNRLHFMVRNVKEGSASV
ncbi:MAG: CoA protein activase, partial [Bacteroidetes bacterium]|nr:CoA protein activase [Bacteroidota bacterium]